MVYRPTTKLCNQNVHFTELKDSAKTYNAIEFRIKLTELLRQYFSKDYITIGTLGRKILPFLSALVTKIGGSWEALAYFYKETNTVLCWFSHNGDTIFSIRINCVNSSERRSYKQVVHRLFTKDRFFEGKHRYLEARMFMDNKYYLYTKSLSKEDSFILSMGPYAAGIQTKWWSLIGSRDKLICVSEGFPEGIE